ncbi:CLUMA_CG013280, isoform A [Clunio marinus]|uniref:CLUMA_CG013280, isoform A n=1 Tax=Clunio marinus TaxID=568069 RepID=A0A1J1IKB9_9DIPT|nr:CLUMA_CG013280, isoform A [Clunio marinus]
MDFSLDNQSTTKLADMTDQKAVDHQNETIAENAKKSKLPKRICLVGTVVDDDEVASAAKLFNVPVLSSETGKEFCDDDTWMTYYILKEFEGPIFENIYRAAVKNKILGPPALLSASKNVSDGLPQHNRPIYNYSMKGVVTTFTGIRKRDELTQLVHLIHFMGGSIRKEMNHRATHLICSNAYGEKYRYALTFRLNVVRSSWVLNAWENRNEAEFSATNETFTTNHRLKIFEGCRVAFIGFPDFEKANMADLLRSYNGIETTSDDDTCTHKIIADCPVFANDVNNATFDNSNAVCDDDFVGDDEDKEENFDDTNDYASQIIQRKHESFLRHFEQIEKDGCDLPIVMEEDEASKSATSTEQNNKSKKDHDGVILRDEDGAFSNARSISPIFKPSIDERRVEQTTAAKVTTSQEEDYDAFPYDSIYDESQRETGKRKRLADESFENFSFMSTESTKKPKLSRAGSITKTFKRRMSFGIATPIKKIFKQRRNSSDSNSSICSTLTNLETTFNESIKEPIKEKFRQIKHKVCKLSKSVTTTPKSAKVKARLTASNLSNFKDICKLKSYDDYAQNTPETSIIDSDAIEFKTPKVPCPNSVVDESTVKYDHGSEESKFFVVKAEWFWTRIAEGYAPEDDFLYKDYMQSIRNEQAEKCERRDSLINYSAKTQRKRKRLSRIVNDGTPVSAGKRRSSISDAGILSESLIDYTASPDKNETPKSSEDIVNEFSTKKFSMRHNHFMDFYHTESNYVGILETIVKLFKLPLEKMADENPDESDLLNKSEVKAIFSNFLPIYEVHRKMLNTLQEINSSWKEDCAIGQIILDNRDSLLKAYPPYVNFFEQMKTTLIEAAQSKPRFQAFLKINQAKPECGRQSLQDLMIRPVQRLPSISLLLNDILKHTPKANRDQDLLSEALKAIKEVMTYINEDKRKTEGQKQMFNIFNEIENCPPHLISSHRSFISRCECTELSETLSGRGDSLVLFLFTDTLVICKKRSRFHSSKSPNSTKSNSSSIKPYKHIKLIPLSSIRTLADIMDSPRAFAISLRSSINIQDMSKDKLYSFTFRLATRTRLKVGRAFSFTKTPSRKIRGSNVSLTPSTISSMSHLKLQSSLTLNDFDMERKTHDSVPVPLTDQMSRKNMNPTGLGDM